MIFTHHGMLSRGGVGDLKDFLYLTYFNRFNCDTFTDYPIRGDKTVYLNSVDFQAPNYTAYKIKLNGMPALQIVANQSTPRYFHAQLLKDVQEEVISVECIAKQPGTYSYSSELGLLDLNHKDVPYDSCCILLSSEYSKATKTYWTRNFGFSPQNGAYYDYQGQRRGYRIPFQIYDKVVHYAVTLNKTDNSGRFYVDGTLYMEFSGINSTNIFNVLAFEFLNNSTSVPLAFTQLAVRRGDCSTDGGSSYTVPGVPYFRI